MHVLTPHFATPQIWILTEETNRQNRLFQGQPSMAYSLLQTWPEFDEGSTAVSPMVEDLLQHD